MRTDLEKQWMLCSEWVPSEWESKQLIMLDLFQLSSSKDINWWTGVDYLWCFNQLFGLSFWRHPFTAEHSMLRQWCNASFLQICSHNLLNTLDFASQENVRLALNKFIYICTEQDKILRKKSFSQCAWYDHKIETIYLIFDWFIIWFIRVCL